MKSSLVLKVCIAVSAVLILAALILSPQGLVEFLTGNSADSGASLLEGATFFKANLLLLGIAILILGWLPIWNTKAPGKEPHIEPINPWVARILVLVLLAALVMRLYALNAGLWLDEIVTDVLFVKLPFGSILTTYESENQHFLYSLMAHASYLAFGDSAWSLRLPAVLFGVGSIWAIFLLGREAANPREGLLAAALLAFSYQHVWFSQNARGYTGLLFWTILSSWLLLRAVRGSRTWLWLLFAVSAALGVYTHVTMLFVIAGQFLIYVILLAVRRNKPWIHRWAGLFLGFGLAGLLIVQLYALVLPRVLAGMGREQSLVEAWKNPLWTLFEFVNGLELSFGGGLIVVLAGMVVLIGGLLSYARQNAIVVGLLIIPSLLTTAVVVGLGHHLWPRFFFFAFGFAAVVVIRGVMVLGETAGRLINMPSVKPAWIGIAGCVALIAVSSLAVRLAYGPKQDYDGALNFVETQAEQGDAIVTTGLATFVYERYYKKDWLQASSTAELDSIRAHAKRTWLIYTFPQVLESTSPGVVDAVKHDFQNMRQFDGTVSDGTVFVIRLVAQPSTLSSFHSE